MQIDFCLLVLILMSFCYHVLDMKKLQGTGTVLGDITKTVTTEMLFLSYPKKVFSRNIFKFHQNFILRKPYDLTLFRDVNAT